MTTRLIDALAQMLGDDGNPIAGAQLRFLVAGSTGTTEFQNTYSDLNLSIANANPLPLEAGGRVPPVFVEPVYYRIRYENGDGSLIKEADYVGGPEAAGQFGAWNNEEVYTLDRIVYYSGKYYRSTENGNQGNEPNTLVKWAELDLPEKYSATITYSQYKMVYDLGALYISTQDGNVGNTPATTPNFWQRVNGTPTWGNATSYRQYDRVIGSDGKCYVSQQTPNLNHDPVGDTAFTWWKPESRVYIDEQPQLFKANRMSGGGTLKAEWNNILTDGNAGYLLPLANSVVAETQLMISKADTARTSYPIFTRSGSDLLEYLGGTDTSCQLDTQWADSFILTSNGTDRWRF